MLSDDSWIRIAMAQGLEKADVEVYGVDVPDVGTLQHRKRKAARPAANIDDTLSIPHAREVQEQRGQAAAPSAHHAVIGVGCQCVEFGVHS